MTMPLDELLKKANLLEELRNNYAAIVAWTNKFPDNKVVAFSVALGNQDIGQYEFKGAFLPYLNKFFGSEYPKFYTMLEAEIAKLEAELGVAPL